MVIHFFHTVEIFVFDAKVVVKNIGFPLSELLTHRSFHFGIYFYSSRIMDFWLGSLSWDVSE